MKTCVICFDSIPFYQYLCKMCYPSYKEYMDTEWFKDFILLQRKQDAISQRELPYLPYTEQSDEYGKHKPKIVSEPKSRGRPPKPYSLYNKVLEIYDRHEGKITLRKLSKAVQDETGEYINKDTINTLLKKHRK